MRPATRALVKPRFVSPVTGTTLPLEDEVELLLQQPGPANVMLVGARGSGKTTALRHLAAVFPHAPRLRLADAKDPHTDYPPNDRVFVFVGKRLPPGTPVRTLRLAPWCQDEFIEYLLATHPQDCARVMARVSQREELDLPGLPEVWQIVLEELVLDPALRDPAAAVVRYLHLCFSGGDAWQQLEAACLEFESMPAEERDDARLWKLPRLRNTAAKMLEHACIRHLLAAESLATDLKDERHKCRLPPRLPVELVQAVGRRITSNQRAHAQLRKAMRSPVQQPMAASLLHAVEPAWKPTTRRRLSWQGAHLQGVEWSSVALERADLRSVNLSRANLGNSSLDGALASNADLSGADLECAALNGLIATGADLSGANLSSARAQGARLEWAKLGGACLDGADFLRDSFRYADLRDATFCRAHLAHVDFSGAAVAGADFSNADLAEADFAGMDLRQSTLDGACLRGVCLAGANLEGMDLDLLDLRAAHLERALLTGSSMVAGDLCGACLRGAGLADVEWEGASLCGADLSGASFHLGSSRSGLVGSPLASEGTRTGFYTDDFSEQDFKAPEEIRRANLRNADLRQAIVTGVDFYLVDLRGAYFDAIQEQHFRRCGAILEDRHCP